MLAATTMVQPPRPPPPQPPAGRRPPSSRSKINRPPPPRGPPPPPPPGLPRKRPANVSQSSRKMSRTIEKSPLKNSSEIGRTIMKPTVLRDVTVFDKKHQLGKGTYGDVFMGADKETKEIVALKRINTEQEANYGFPITTIREVKILKALNHPNIVKLKEIVTSKEQSEIPKSVFLVFEYHEYDLTGILGTREIRLTQDHIKSWSMQLLQGVNYMHVNKIIHRDLKASNILIGRSGELKIADWGLARTWNDKMKNLTNPVITLWYRPPELLLGCRKYSPKIDMWSIGCIIAEMFRRTGFLTGSTDASQIDLIFKTLGHPNLSDWPDIHQSCPRWLKYKPVDTEHTYKSRLRETLRSQLPNPAWMTENATCLIQNLLTYNPATRWSAQQAIEKAEYFFEAPAVAPAEDLYMKFGIKAAHEWGLPKKQNMRQRKVNGDKKKFKPPPPSGKPRAPI